MMDSGLTPTLPMKGRSNPCHRKVIRVTQGAESTGCRRWLDGHCAVWASLRSIPSSLLPPESSLPLSYISLP